MAEKSESKKSVDKKNAKITTVLEFIEKITEFSRKTQTFKCFRGQRDSGWSIQPSLFRKDVGGLEKHEMRAVRDLIAVHPSEFSTDQTMFDRLVRMQHFGLPTRLLDVSLNPIIALYFATEVDPHGQEADGKVTAFSVPAGREKYYDSDTVSCISNLANLSNKEKNDILLLRASRVSGTSKEDEVKRLNISFVYKKLHQFIRAEKSYFLPLINPIDLFKPYYVHPKLSNKRVVAQSGGFIIFGLAAPKGIKFAEPISSYNFIIDKNYKRQIRQDLDFLGINESNLFPEIDKTASRIRNKYRQ